MGAYVHGAVGLPLWRRFRTDGVRSVPGAGGVGRAWGGAYPGRGAWARRVGRGGANPAGVPVSTAGGVRRQRLDRRRGELRTRASVSAGERQDPVGGRLPLRDSGAYRAVGTCREPPPGSDVAREWQNLGARRSRNEQGD